MLQRLESLQEEIRLLHGEIEVQNHTLQQLKKRQQGLYADLDRRMQRLESGPPATTQSTITTDEMINPPLETLSAINDASGHSENGGTDPALTVEVVEQDQTGAQLMTVTPDPIPPQEETNADDIPVIEVKTDPLEARADYQQAFTLLNNGRYDQSIKAFNTFLMVHPSSEYADNAQFWLGEVYMINGDYEQALREFNKVVQRYPASRKLNQAKLKIAYTHHELGQIELAREQLQELMELNPGTTIARLAQERLKEMTGAPAETTGTN